MIFRQVALGPMQNFSYILGDEKTKDAVVVDVGWDSDTLIETAEKDRLKIKKIILTHYHYDHVQKINELALKTKAIVMFHENDAIEILKVFGHNKVRHKKLRDGSKIKLGRNVIKIIHTPGHTKGSICLLAENKLITGDTLFVGAIGRTDLPGGDKFTLFESLQKIKSLPDSTEIYPGHDYGKAQHSTIGEEKKYNPYLMCNTKQQFIMLVGF